MAEKEFLKEKRKAGTIMTLNIPKDTVICISREYGSGGREIAETLAKKLNIPCYDKLLIQKAAKESGYSEEFLNEYGERPLSLNNLLAGNPFSDTFSMAHSFYPESQLAFDIERKTILEIAQKGGGVIVGRCASSILSGREHVLSVFIYGDQKSRVERVMARNQISEAEARKRIHKIDRMRKRHFDFYADTIWGQPESYDLMLSSSHFGIEKCVDLIIESVAQMES